MVFAAVRPLHDEFGGSVAVDRKVQFILYLCKKGFGGRGILVVIHAGGINIGNFLLKLPFTQPNLPDFFQKPFEVILAKKRAILHALLVQHIALDGELPQHLGAPLAELGCPNRVYPIPHRDDGVEVVKLGQIALAVCGSIPEFPDN